MAAAGSCRKSFLLLEEPQVRDDPLLDWLDFVRASWFVFSMDTRTKSVATIPYFAYGSNLFQPHLAAWCVAYGIDPNAISNPRRGVLDGFRLRTNYLRAGATGAANLEPFRTGRVEGVVYSITPKALELLRRKEGHPYRYSEMIVGIKLLDTGRCIQSLTYSVVPRFRLRRNMPVAPEYRELVLQGASSHRLSAAYQRRLARLLRPTPDFGPQKNFGNPAIPFARRQNTR